MHWNLGPPKRVGRAPPSFLPPQKQSLAPRARAKALPKIYHIWPTASVPRHFPPQPQRCIVGLPSRGVLFATSPIPE
jgi:hypothetical protein